MLKERIQKDIIIAMRAKEKDERELLRFIMSQIMSKEKEAQRSLEDGEIIDILKKEIKQTQEARAIADSTSLRWRESFIERYLPRQLDEAEIAKLVDLASKSHPTMKECITFCMKEYGAICDKKTLSALIRAKY